MKIDKSKIAPCGMNCALCLAFQRKIKPCPGCNGPDENKTKSCVKCSIKNCENLALTKTGFCSSCTKFPCARLKQLDKRYKTKYKMSMIDNLRFMEMEGISDFLQKEKEKWTCPNCASLLCVHRDVCQSCGK